MAYERPGAPRLSYDDWYEIFLRMDSLEDLLNLAQVSVDWRDLVRSDAFQRHILFHHPLIEPRLRDGLRRLLKEEPALETRDPETQLLYIGGAPWTRIVRACHAFLKATNQMLPLSPLAFDMVFKYVPGEADKMMAETKLLMALRGLVLAEDLERIQWYLYMSYDPAAGAYLAEALALPNPAPSTTLVPPPIIMRLLLEMLTPVDELPPADQIERLGELKYEYDFLVGNVAPRLILADDLASLRQLYHILRARTENKSKFNEHWLLYSMRSAGVFARTANLPENVIEFFEDREMILSPSGIRTEVYTSNLFTLAAALGRVSIIRWAVTESFVNGDGPAEAPLALTGVLSRYKRFPLQNYMWRQLLFGILMPAIRYARLEVVRLLNEMGLAPLWSVHPIRIVSTGHATQVRNLALEYARFKLQWLPNDVDSATRRAHTDIVKLLEEADNQVLSQLPEQPSSSGPAQ